MSYNSLQKLKGNIAAVQIAFEWKQGQMLLPEQVEALKRYAGFGGLKAVLYPNAPKEEWIKLKASKEDLKLYPDFIELHKLLQQHFKEVGYKQAIVAYYYLKFDTIHSCHRNYIQFLKNGIVVSLAFHPCIKMN
ncbi:MAG: hypothetical protein ABIN01_08815 [Ferruginibacter sp.]